MIHGKACSRQAQENRNGSGGNIPCCILEVIGMIGRTNRGSSCACRFEFVILSRIRIGATMSTPDTIHGRLGTISCPICRKQDFLIRIRKENPDGENEYTASCAGCRYSFPVSTENRLYRLSNPDVDSWLNNLTCPRCERRGAEMDFRSILTVRQVRTFVHCRSCGFEFNEEMAAEAYE